jgi:site-specific recombinase XerD
VKLHRKHVDLRTINEILGQSSLTATKHLVQGDTRRLSDLVAGVI